MKKRPLFFLIPTFLFLTQSFSQNQKVAFARKDNLWGYIDKTGKFIITPIYDNVSDFFMLKE